MVISYQTISASGSFSPPCSTDILYGTKKSADSILYFWEREHNKVGSDSNDATLLAWKGNLLDIQGIYPDYEITRGKRGGIVWNIL
jgi:hypothetical protein